MTFFWQCQDNLPTDKYLFSAELDGTVLATRDGSEIPRQAISEVILAAMAACGTFSGLSRTVPSAGARSIPDSMMGQGSDQKGRQR
ncbi:hypothetical protein [Deinococcus yavapaiensis]|uniref:hypothetical protein n=1 Tax=Deinococcus yavapaiensis TaxID=309889 RepID=UPI0011B6A672|nr:hypothetical protein [Deinococcus yavapaiensis]